MTRASTTSPPPPVAAISVRPIHSEADYAATLDEIAGLMHAGQNTPEADRLDVLATLVEAYEAKHYPIDPPDPIAAIWFRMEQQGLTPQNLEPFIGTRARVSEVLNRRRPLSLSMIRRLAEGLGIPAAVLIRPTGAPSARGAAGKPSSRGIARKAASRGVRKAAAKGSARAASKSRLATPDVEGSKGAGQQSRPRSTRGRPTAV